MQNTFHSLISSKHGLFGFACLRHSYHIFFIQQLNAQKCTTAWTDEQREVSCHSIWCAPPSRGEPDGENPSPSTRRRKTFTIPAKELQTSTGEDIQPMGEIRRWTRYICLSSPESLCCHLLHQHYRITWRNVIKHCDIDIMSVTSMPMPFLSCAMWSRNYISFKTDYIAQILWHVFIVHTCIITCIITQQTRSVGPMLGWRWASVVDDGPTSAQHWANASCLLGTYMHNNMHTRCARSLKLKYIAYLFIE